VEAFTFIEKDYTMKLKEQYKLEQSNFKAMWIGQTTSKDIFTN